MNFLNERLVEAFAGQAIIQVQNPVGLGSHSEPQPDFSVLRFREDGYRGKAPESKDVWLAVEVSDLSLRYDLQTKMPLYAGFAVPALWVVDVPHATLHVFDELIGDAYQRREVFTSFDQLTITVTGQYPVRLDGLF